MVTPLEGLREALGESVEIAYHDGSDPAAAAQVARDADLVVLVVGYTSEDEGEYIGPDMIGNFIHTLPKPTAEEMKYAEMIYQQNANQQQSEGFAEGGDRVSLTLTAKDEALIHAVAAANPRVVVAIMTGSAVITESWRNLVPGILVMWYPGMEGGRALADLLTGKANPSGRLPCTFPARAEDLPYYDKKATHITYDLWHGYRKLERDGARPAFPFGFGLSYTTFEYSQLRLEQDRLAVDGTLEASLVVTNTGSLAGEEVVQFYAAVPGSQVERAPKELKAFQRVALEPGQSATVRLSLPVERLAYYAAGQGWTVEKTTYTLIAARHSLDEQALSAGFQVD